LYIWLCLQLKLARRDRRRAASQEDQVDLTPGQLDRMSRVMDTWSVMWDKRRSLWIAAEDAPDGEQIEEADLEVLLTRMELAITQPRG
jgi:hypothetical protein